MLFVEPVVDTRSSMRPAAKKDKKAAVEPAVIKPLQQVTVAGIR